MRSREKRGQAILVFDSELVAKSLKEGCGANLLLAVCDDDSGISVSRNNRQWQPVLQSRTDAVAVIVLLKRRLDLVHMPHGISETFKDDRAAIGWVLRLGGAHGLSTLQNYLEVALTSEARHQFEHKHTADDQSEHDNGDQFASSSHSKRRLQSLFNPPPPRATGESAPTHHR